MDDKEEEEMERWYQEHKHEFLYYEDGSQSWNIIFGILYGLVGLFFVGSLIWNACCNV